MIVKILMNVPRVVDGVRVGPFKKGQQLDMEKSLADKFIASAMAEEVKPVIASAEVVDDKPSAAAKKGKKAEA